MRAYSEFILKFRVVVIIVMSLLTVAFGREIGSLKVIMNIDELMPQNHPYVIAENLIERIFGNKHMVVIGITAREGTFLQPAIFNKVRRITDELSLSPDIVKSNLNSLASKKAKSISGTEEGMVVQRFSDLIQSQGLSADDIKRELSENPIYEGLFFSSDFATTIITAEFRRTDKGMVPIDKYIRAILDRERDETVEIVLGGRPIFQSLFEQYGARTGLLFLIAVLIVGLIHLEAFRSLQSLFLPLVTAIFAVIWALGVLSISGHQLDVFNAMTPILILAIAAGHAVQVLKRYYEEFADQSQRHPQLDRRTASHLAVVNSLTKIGPVMVIAGSVAAMGFLSLMFFDVSTIRIFGLFSAFGILSALILELTLIPAVRACLSPPSSLELRHDAKRTIWVRIIDWAFQLCINRRSTIFILASVVFLILSLGMMRLTVENDLRSHVYGNVEQLLDDEKLNQRMAGTSTFQIMIDSGQVDGIKSPKVMQGIASIQTLLASVENVGKSISIADLTKQMNKAINGGDRQFFNIPDSQELISQIMFLYSNSGDPDDFDSYVDRDYRRALIRVFLKTGSNNFASSLAEKIQHSAKSVFPASVSVSLGGGVLGSAAINEVMVRDKILNVVQILGCVFLISAFVFRSIVAGLLIVVPLIAAVVANFGLMGWLGVPLQTATSFISALAVGIGADYAIYMTCRMREELRENKDEHRALQRAFFSAGKAILFVSSAMAGGFGVLVFSIGYSAHLWSGLFVALAMLVSSIASLTIFPALILQFRPKFIFERNSERGNHETQ